MTDVPPIEPLEPALDALIDAERAAPPPAGAALGRVWSRLASLPPTGGLGSSGAASPRGLVSRTAFFAGIAFIAGVATGAGLHHALSRPLAQPAAHAPPPPVPQTVPAVEIPPPPGPQAVPDPPSLPAPQTAPRASAARPTMAPAASSLSAERALLDVARTALAQGDEERALALTDEHAKKFSQPRLGEEREAIAIQALVLLGRHDDARSRAARFRSAFPGSLFLPSVEASLASIP